MSLDAVVGQLMRSGLSPTSRARLEHSMGENGLGGSGGLGDILSGMLGDGATDASAAGGGGGLLGGLGNILSGSSGVGGLNRGEVGGLGALAGALLGGGSMKGAIGGGAMALLGTVALSALRNRQAPGETGPAATRTAAAAQASANPSPPLSKEDVRQMTAPETAELCLVGMIEAAKADGKISTDEIGRITGKLEEGGITAGEQRFVMEQMSKPADPQRLIAAIPNREVGAQVYAAALLAISADTDAERQFLADLARGSRLDIGTVRALHAIVGAPTMAA
ncbi:tellurite resistance TerB family protein [Pelagibius sp. 7325]|uniref:tellurite resistance TerB family protein n=1 Tax=Pelagibius sp. 7325 TaxID=3131994 RepID=UPI0030EF611D